MKIDHLVLTVRDVKKTCEFYSQALGMRVVTLKGGRKALHFGEQKINLQEAGKEFEPKALNPTPGSLDICFISYISLTHVIAHIESLGIKIVSGPERKTGATGPIESIYVRDPDGNLVEISNYLKENV
jgi:catechol 2,3-dioxygenase-like lactoylglutathione lyase family enzyme